jgi:parallel beta-helix repeat protein
MRTRTLAGLLTVVVLLTAPAAAPALDLYVATNGHDGWSGTLPAPNDAGDDGPLATLEGARDAIRAKKGKGEVAAPVTVHIRGGEYFRDKPFELTQPDGGTADAPVTYRAYRDEPVRLIGGVKVTNWEPLDADGPAAKRIPAEARSHVVRADLKAAGVTDSGDLKPGGFGGGGDAALELFFDDVPMTLARWPNEGFVKIADVAGQTPVESHGRKGCKEGRFIYEGDRPSRWTGEDDVWVHGFFFWDWADFREKVESIDTDKRLIALVPSPNPYGYRKGARYYAFNVLAELDMPGEWYLDRTTGVLYFWPPKPIAQAAAYVSTTAGMIQMKDVAHVTIRGLTIEVCRGTAVRITGGSNDRIAGCALRNIGRGAVVINGGHDNGVRSCEITGTGDHGVVLSGGDRKKLTPARHYSINNHIHHYSRWNYTYRSAVRVNGVGQIVEHNLIHDAPHNAIGLSGNDHRIRFNEVHHVCMMTDDAGAFYMGRDWTERGNEVSYNYFHHIGTFKSWVGTISIYLDDFSSGVRVHGNICYRGGRGVLIGGGRDNEVTNNIFVECNPSVHVDARGLGWAANYFDGQYPVLFERLEAMPYKTPPWSERYPALLNIVNDEPANPKYNVIARNISVGGKWLDLHNGLTDKVVTVKDNLVDEDPHFVDAAAGDFRLRDDSPAFELGFERIPVEKIGLQVDEFRRRVPQAAVSKD